MKIQSYVVVRNGVTSSLCTSEAYDIDFDSFADFAFYFRNILSRYNAEQALVFFDSFRFALVTPDSCDFHYHFNFSKYEKAD